MYGKLQSPKPEGAGLAPRTVGHVHRLLHRVYGHAVKWSVVGRGLRAHRQCQQEQRLALGLDAAAADLVFARPDGGAWPPDRLSSNWAKAVRSMKLPKVTFHALRHTHVSQLIAVGLDVATVSRRIGHSNPTITLPDHHVAPPSR